MERALRKETLLKWLLIGNIIFSLIVMLYAIGAALGTGLLLGGLMLNLSVVAYFIHRNGRVILGIVGQDIASGTSS